MSADNPADDPTDAQTPPPALQAKVDEIAEQAERQKEFQLTILFKNTPDAEASKEFHLRLVEFVKAHLEGDTEVGLAEVSFVLWNELNRLEEILRTEDATDSEGRTGSKSALDDVDESAAEPTGDEQNGEEIDGSSAATADQSFY